MIFIHPVILADRDDGDYYTRKRYDDVRKAQVDATNGATPLLGGGRPLLVPFSDYEKQVRPATPSESDPKAAAPAAQGPGSLDIPPGAKPPTP